eukprot:2450334-Prymnesium_polylepis.1
MRQVILRGRSSSSKVTRAPLRGGWAPSSSWSLGSRSSELLHALVLRKKPHLLVFSLRAGRRPYRRLEPLALVRPVDRSSSLESPGSCRPSRLRRGGGQSRRVGCARAQV